MILRNPVAFSFADSSGGATTSAGRASDNSGRCHRTFARSRVVSSVNLLQREAREVKILGKFRSSTSVVEFREQLKLVGLLFVMIDEERRLVHCDHLPDFFHRRH